MRKFIICLCLLFMGSNSAFAGSNPANPILFVTQYPIISDFTTIGSTFGNHMATMQSAGRGGDLYIRYPDGTLRNLTREAGYGNSGFQGANAIAVRDPTVHWDGSKALFSMVIGAPEQQFVYNDYYWQMYEVTGLAQGQTINITKIANQPEDYNNITPIYSSDGNIIFTSDMPRTKNRFNYPQHDEYESSPTNTGLWKLNSSSGQVSLIQHSPSGSFTPIIDSFGRVVFTRWDHMQRDQQASPTNVFDAFNYEHENEGATAIDSVAEVFPEPRPAETDLLEGTNLEGLRFNHFFPWEINQDGTAEETLNHVGRHEFHSYFNRSINDDSNVIEFIAANSGRANQNSILNVFHIHEDPSQAGKYVAIDAPEFATHSGGQIISFSLPKGDLRPDLVTVDYLTHESTRGTDDSPPPEHVGFFRDPLTLNDSTLLASHTSETRSNGNEGTLTNPIPRYMFQLKSLTENPSGDLVPDQRITTLGDVNISYFSPDFLITYNGPLWELQAVEVVARAIPPMTSESTQSPEQQIFAEENVDEEFFKDFLRNYNLAVVVMRDITTRDLADKQQPYNLKVAGAPHQTIGSAGNVYEISHMQFFQGDQIRGYGGIVDPDPGQRVLAQYLHDQNAMSYNPEFAAAPVGSTEIFEDGSAAFFVPAHRATAWQSLDPLGTPVVRERYWITFQPGEIRACGGCHGVNNVDQSGGLPSVQKSEAFRALLQHWQNTYSDLIFANGF